MALLNRLLGSWDGASAARQAALDRAHSDPGIPIQEGTTKSFWMKDQHPTINKNDLQNGVDQVDVAIIGSGITGLSVAHTIMSASGAGDVSKLSVMILEARDVCSGGTGRNGGHILETAEEYSYFKKVFGKKDAIKLIKFRRGHVAAMNKLVGDNDYLKEYCQLREVEFVSVYFDECQFKEAVENLEEFTTDMPEESRGFASRTGRELVNDLGLSRDAVGAITGPAGAVWPYRLVTNALDDLLKKHPSSFFIRTGSPVISIDQCDGKAYTYELKTPGGVVYARHVVHCTNGHIGHLVPGLRGRVVPLRGQMSAQEPGAKFKSQGNYHSWVFNYVNGFDYLTQLPGGGTGSAEEMMFGGGLSSLPYQGVIEIGVPTDEKLQLAADIHLRGALPAVFGSSNWGAPGNVKSMWTGIMGFTTDNFPWVGELPESLTGRPSDENTVSREWAAAGFCGEGMVQAWGSGKAVALMLLQKEGGNAANTLWEHHEWFPSQLRITEDRIFQEVLPKSI